MSEYIDMPNLDLNPQQPPQSKPEHPRQPDQPNQQPPYNTETQTEPPKSENKKPDPRLNQKILIGIVIILVVLVIAFGVRDGEDTNDVAEQEEITDTTENTTYENGVPSFNDDVFNYVTSNEWEETEIATINIGLLGSGQIISEGIVTDPNNEDLVYFASLIYSPEPEISQVGIYKYYLSNNNFERIFRAEYAVDEFSYLVGGVPGLNTYGYDNGKLILLAHVIGASPGSCTQPVLLGSGDRQSFNLLSMDLEDPYAGFEEYTASEATITQAEAVMAECQGEVTE